METARSTFRSGSRRPMSPRHLPSATGASKRWKPRSGSCARAWSRRAAERLDPLLLGLDAEDVPDPLHGLGRGRIELAHQSVDLVTWRRIDVEATLCRLLQ